MLNPYFPQAVAALAGVCSGCVLGLSITTKTEAISRGMQSRFHPLTRTTASAKLTIRGMVTIVLLAGLVVFVALSVLSASGVDYLSGDLKMIFGVSFLVGAGVGKCARYLYWKRA